MQRRPVFLFLLFIFATVTLTAQNYSSEMAAFKKQDSISFPPKDAILFIGSSSFTKWTDVQQYFPGRTIINRGFGGSTLPDVIAHEEDVIFPYQPKQVVIYFGENDISYSYSISATIVLQRFRKLFMDIRSKLPGVSMVYISMKPSPSRWNMKDRLMAGNLLIKKYLKKKKNASFVSVWEAMLGTDGQPIPGIFLSDHLHMNAKGYAIWQKLMAPYLIK